MDSKYEWKQAEQQSGAVERAADAVQRVKEQTGNALRGSFYAVCLVAIILVEILRRFVTGSINKAFTWETVFAALVASLTTLLTFYMFFPSGKGAGMLKSAFVEAQQLMEKAVKRINAGLKTAFRAYCTERSAEEAEEERQAAFETLADLYVTREEFENVWRLASWWRLRVAVWRHEITRAARKQILRCRKPFVVEAYIPDHFTAGVSTKKQKKMLRGDSYETRVLLQKPLMVMLVIVAQSAFTMAIHGAGDALEVLFAIVMSVFQICLAAFSGYIAGQKVAEHMIAVNLVKAGFMMDFLEKEEIALEAETEKTTA